MAIMQYSRKLFIRRWPMDKTVSVAVVVRQRNYEQLMEKGRVFGKV
jgi:hypothetical protein